MSQYVKRCAGECGRVRGVSAFALVKRGERAPVCRFCVANQKSAEYAARSDVRAKLRQLSATESNLRKQLARVAREKLALSLHLQRGDNQLSA